MAGQDHAKEVRLAGTVLGCHRHVCAFVNSKEEEYRVLMPFIREGFEQGDRACHIVDPRHRAQHLETLREAGIDVGAAEESGQLEVCDWEETFLQDGCFDMDRQIALIDSMLGGPEAKRFPRTRLIGNAEWALKSLPGVQDLVEYECRVNRVLSKYDDPACCVYDVTQFGASMILDILRVHPAVIVGGILYENSFYTPPGVFLRELRERATGAIAAG